MTQQFQNPHGEARFAFPEEIRAAGLFGREGVEFGLYHGRPLRHFNRASMKILGAAGSGKTSQIAIPMILSATGPVVILDFKNGEISQVIEAHCALKSKPMYTVDAHAHARKRSGAVM